MQACFTRLGWRFQTVLKLQMNCNKIVFCMLFCDDHLFCVDTYNNPYQGTGQKCGSIFFLNLFVFLSSDKDCIICFVVVWNYIIYKTLSRYLCNDYKEGKASEHNNILTCTVRSTTWDFFHEFFILYCHFISVLPQRTFSSRAVFQFN